MEQAGRERLAEAVRGRRHWLGLSQECLADRGGPSHRVVRQIESGKSPTKPNDATLAKLERGLGWKQGTARSILDGTGGDDPDMWISAEPAFLGTSPSSAIPAVPPVVSAGIEFLDLINKYHSDNPDSAEVQRLVLRFISNVLKSPPPA